MAGQLAIAVFISKCIRAGAGPRMVETNQDEAKYGFKFAGSGLPHTEAESNTGLSALLTAVAPQSREVALAEDPVASSAGRTGTLLAWPDSKA